MEIFKLWGSILINNDDANKSIGKTGKQADGLTKKLGKGVKAAGKWAAGLTAAAAGVAAGAFAMTKKVTGGLDEIATTAEKAGVTTDYLQEMDYWASQNNVSSNQMEKALERLNQRMGRAADGNEKYSDALVNLGINMDDVRDGTVSTEDAFATSIKTLSEMENSQEQAAVASELFGTKLSRDLMPALQDGSLSIEEAKEKAHELGLVIGEESIQDAQKFEDTWSDLKGTLAAFGQQIFVELIPVFQNMMDWVMEHMPQIQEIFKTVFDVMSTSVSTLGTFLYEQVLLRFQSLYEWLEPHLPAIKEAFLDTFEFVKDILGGVVDAIKSLTKWFQDHWGIVEPILIGIAAGIATFKAITIGIQAYGAAVKIATGLQLLLNGALSANPIGIVVVAIGALVAAGVALWKNWDTVVVKVSNLWSNMKSYVGKIKTFTVDSFNGIKTGISKVWNSIKSTTKRTWSAMTNIVKAPVNTIIGFINSMINALNGVKIKVPKVPDWVPFMGGKGGNTIGFNIPNVPSLDVGTNFVAGDGLAMLHRGEAVVPKEYNPAAGGESVSNAMTNALLERIAKGIEAGHSIQIDGEEVAKHVGEQFALDHLTHSYFSGQRF